MLEKCSMKEKNKNKIKLKKKKILLKYKKEERDFKRRRKKKAYCASVKKEVTQTKIDELKKNVHMKMP